MSTKESVEDAAAQAQASMEFDFGLQQDSEGFVIGAMHEEMLTQQAAQAAAAAAQAAAQAQEQAAQAARTSRIQAVKGPRRYK